jgi:TolB-like protein
MAERNAGTPPENRIELRIGINLGDVIAEEHDIFGDGVNVAARLEALAEPGRICISRVVRDQVRDKLDYTFEDQGEHQVKNITRPVRVYSISAEAVRSPPLIAAPTPASDPAPTTRLSIVVLPFVNLSNDPEQEYFADGITEDLTTDLSRISQSFVIARNTAFSYKGKPIDVRQLGRELGVRYALVGSVRRVGDQVRVNVQLLDAGSGASLWADRFDTDRASFGEAQNEITGRLARMLNLQLMAAAARRIERHRLVDPDARDLVMRGWAAYYGPKSVATTGEARRFFEHALEIDPQSVDAMTGLALNLVHGLGALLLKRMRSAPSSCSP